MLILVFYAATLLWLDVITYVLFVSHDLFEMLICMIVCQGSQQQHNQGDKQ